MGSTAGPVGSRGGRRPAQRDRRKRPALAPRGPLGEAFDVIVVTPAHVERYKDSHPLVIKPALREGTVLYEAA